jgi:hypothetical protein
LLPAPDDVSPGAGYLRRWEYRMSKENLTLVSVILFSLAMPASPAAENPLFQTDEPLALVLEFPLKDLLRQKKEKATVPGVVRYTDLDGSEVTLDVGVSTRGNSRRSMSGSLHEVTPVLSNAGIRRSASISRRSRSHRRFSRPTGGI